MRAAAVGGVCLLLFALVGGVAALGAAGPGGGAPPASAPVELEKGMASLDNGIGGSGGSLGAPSVETPTRSDNDTRTQLIIDLRANGNAQWTVATYLPIESESDRKAFEDLKSDWIAGDVNVGPSVDLFRTYAAATEEATGREMAIRDVSVNRTGYARNDTGVLVLRFTWLNFARTGDSQVIVDDAFRTVNGTWLPELEAGQVLIISPPQGYLPATAQGDIINGSIHFRGPETFEPGELSVTFERSAITPTSTTPPTPTTSLSPTTSPPGPGPDEGFNPMWLGVLALGLVVVAYFVLTDRGPGPAWGLTSDGPEAGNGDGGATGGSATAGAPDATHAEGAGRHAGEGSGAVEGAAGTGAPGAGAAGAASTDDAESATEPTPEDPFAGVDVDLLSDEERVTRLLEANGGRMKQATIVKETGWSNAKVSQLLSGMDEDDQIDKLRIGRENLISLPGEEIGGNAGDS